MSGQVSNPHRVLVVDDDSMVRKCLLSMFRKRGMVQMIGEAASGLEAVEMSRRLHPDVILMDESMPEMGGIEATRRIKQERPEVRIIGLSGTGGEELQKSFLDAGAEAFVPKGCGCFEAVFAAICERLDKPFSPEGGGP